MIYSTYFSGTQTDTISFAAMTPSGFYLSGIANSPDLPGFDGSPAQCLPQTYASRMSADATEVGAARPVPGNVLAYDAASGALLTWNGADLAAFDPAAPPAPIACILDSADARPVASIAPGELLSIFGEKLSGSTFAPAPANYAASFDGASVSVNGMASPLLYVSPRQINFQAPYEIAGAAEANIAFASTQLNLSDSRTLPVVARNPVAFLDTVTPRGSLAFFSCGLNGEVYNGGPLPLAFNSDGSRNSCANPAAHGSVVTIFLAGLGVTSPAPMTGAIGPNPGTALNLAIAPSNPSFTVVSAAAQPGAIEGVWEIAVRLPPNDIGALSLSLSVDGVPVRGTNLAILAK